MEPFENVVLSFKCPKSLDKLQLCNGGWYCDGCRKIVHDFRAMSEAQVLDQFAQSKQPLCGVYNFDQIKVAPQKPKWQRWVSVAMMALGVSMFHSKASAQKRPSTDSITIREPSKNALNQDTVFGMVELQPSFPGGENAFKDYLHQRIKNDSKFQGRAFAQFTIEKDGLLTNIKILRSAGKELDQQIIDALKNCPKWRPGIQNGKPVHMQYTIPVNFSKTEP